MCLNRPRTCHFFFNVSNGNGDWKSGVRNAYRRSAFVALDYITGMVCTLVATATKVCESQLWFGHLVGFGFGMGNTLRGWDSPAQAERFGKADYTSPGGF